MEGAQGMPGAPGSPGQRGLPGKTVLEYVNTCTMCMCVYLLV